MSGIRRVRMEAPAQNESRLVYVPMKYLELATGYAVHYDEGSRTVVLTSR